MITYSNQLCENAKMFRKCLDAHFDSNRNAYKDLIVDALKKSTTRSLFPVLTME